MNILFQSVIGVKEGLSFSQSESTSQMREAPSGFDKVSRDFHSLNYRVCIQVFGQTQVFEELLKS